MPAKNAIKTYVANGYYHIYNRGVDKNLIFKEQQDYSVFLSYLKIYLVEKNTKTLLSIISNPHVDTKHKDQALRELNLNNYFNKIRLFAYCLMPNHFHFLIQQTNESDMESFMQSSMTRYTAFFNKKYKRVGPLFQGKYKAVMIDSDEQLLYLTRYIHRNPLSIKDNTDIFAQPSSYNVYLGTFKQDWIQSHIILAYFSKTGFNSYRSFIESKDGDIDEKTTYLLKNYFLDNEY